MQNLFCKKNANLKNKQTKLRLSNNKKANFSYSKTLK